MRIALFLGVAVFGSSCLTMFGIHHARARDASTKVIGQCDDLTAEADHEDGWLWRVTGCQKEAWCTYDGREEMQCFTDPPQTRLEKHARAQLRCDQAELAFSPLDLWALDRDAFPWAKVSVLGCDRILWCADPHRDLRCTVPRDLDLAAKQLSVESGCPSASIIQLQYLGLQTQNTYRLDACGSQFSCIVPLVPSEVQITMEGRREVRHDPTAGSRFGSQLTCKAVASAQASPPQLPPPPPPAN